DAQLAPWRAADRIDHGGGKVAADVRLRAALDGEVGGFHHLAAADRAHDHDRLDHLDGGADVAQRYAARGAAARHFDGDVELARAWVVVGAGNLQVGGDRRLEVNRARLAVERHRQVLGFTDARLTGDDLGNARFEILDGDDAARARHRDVQDPAGL